jgi:small conductance mechanosensitive channel
LTGTVAQVTFQIPLDLIQRIAIVALILAATWVISKLLAGFVTKTFQRINPTVARQARRVVIWLTWLTGVILALDQVGMELTVLLAAVGIGALIIVIASRDFLSNIAARETIYLYNQFKIGDWIQVGKVFGRVVDITWNDTVLSTLNNETVYIPNSTITRSVITNRTTQGGIRISVPIIIDNSLSLQEVEHTLLGIGTELQEELVPESKPEVRLRKIDLKTTKLELLIRINNPAKSNLISSEVLKRIKKKLQEKP